MEFEFARNKQALRYLLGGYLSSIWTTGLCNFVTLPYPHKPPVYLYKEELKEENVKKRIFKVIFTCLVNVK